MLRTKPRSALDWVAVIRRGLPAAAVDALTGALRVTQTGLAAAVGVSECHPLAIEGPRGRRTISSSPTVRSRRSPVALGYRKT